MNRCPISYELIDAGDYSASGLYRLDKKLKHLHRLPYTSEELRMESTRRATKMSIQGVQPKLSARLNIKREEVVLVDTNGRYILKPQNALYPELPQNEDLTMRLAAVVGIETPLHGMLWAKDDSLAYFIKRFDRVGRNAKLSLEDFAQLQGRTRETKYDSSMERVVATIDAYCTFPSIEKWKFFRLTLFNFLIGNEDMHLKNFSLLGIAGKIVLSPAYDLLNTTIVLGADPEELALPLHGKKRKLKRTDFIDYLAKERLGIQKNMIDEVLRTLSEAKQQWLSLIEMSFLSPTMKEAYKSLLSARWEVLGI